VPLHRIGKKPSAVLSIPDMALLGTAALLLFGPEQLPRVMRKAGAVMRDVQNTSQTFIREMERAADDYHPPDEKPPDSLYDPISDRIAEEPPVGEKLAEPRPALNFDPSEPAQPPPQSDHAPHV